jgi:putative nucleotidyltransferase with HDIG domain
VATPDSKRQFSAAIYSYVLAVAACGTAAVVVSVLEMLQQAPEYRNQWLSLVALTVVSGLLPVTLPTVNVSISISETFVIAGTLLFGRSGGTVLVLLDAVFISAYLFWWRGLRWQQILFNMAAPPLSIWAAAAVAGIQPLFRTDPSFGPKFILQLTLFTTLYFIFNSWLITFALALQKRARPIGIWWTHFRELLVNYAAGGSIAALLVYNTREVKPEFVLAILPLLVVLFLTYQWSNKRVEAERDKNTQLNHVFLSTIEALALAIDAKDQVTHGHIRRVQRYTIALAQSLGITDDRELDAIRAAALLHDTGKLAVPEYILNKPGPLTPSEFERMKVHAAVGADILKSIDFPYPVEPIVRHHHENWDGSGYPDGLSGQSIPLGARILSVVDCYDALTSDRPYRPRYSREHAEQVLRERRGSWYDPWVVDGFLKIVDVLERIDAEEMETDEPTPFNSKSASKQLDVISATTAEERELNELRRELPLARTDRAASDVLLRHIHKVIPAAGIGLFMPVAETNELHAVASSGVGAAAIGALRIPLGERISGWSFAHRQPVVNSTAALELGPVARTFSTALRYALAVPIIAGQGRVVGVVTCYGGTPFDRDHVRIVESAATLFADASIALSQDGTKPPVSVRQGSDSTIH